MLDISRPKKRTSADVPSAPQLVIPNRSVIVPVSDGAEATTVPVPITPKQVAPSIAPASKDDHEPAEPNTGRPAETAGTAPAVEEPASEEPGVSAASEPVHSEEPKTTAEADPATPERPEEPQEEEPTDENNPKSGKPNPHAHKASEDAKREQEFQKYIDNRDFFVPINAVARKHSLKVGFILIFVEFLLGLFLLNLMLDAGLIHLIEKIPHTNFFDL